MFWLFKHGGVSKVTIDHVNTCYQGAFWPRPADLANELQQTAAKKHWLVTKDAQNIEMTTIGEY